jgi:CDP-diacylglycerol--glycerol-3-phosphate 3-phosphatidyltransferase
MIFSKNIAYLMSHPNALTLYRILATPIVVVLMMFPNEFCTFMAGILFSAAAITDFLDGFYARQRGLVSNFGKIMDPLADKLLVSSAFIMLSALGWISGWIVCVIIGRELAVTGLRNIITESGGDVSASGLGKYKTGFQIAAIIPLLFHYTHFGIDFAAIGNIFLWAALVMTVWSGVDYFMKSRHLLFT